MRRILEAIASDLDRSRRVLIEVVAPLDQRSLDLRPSPEVWSPGEVLDHLATVESQIARLWSRFVEQAAADARAPDPDDETVLRSLDGFAVARVVARIQSREQPVQGRGKADLLERLDGSRCSIAAAIEGAGTHGLAHLRYSHPTLGPLDPYQWLLFVARHDDQHRGQIERALELGAG